MHAQEANYAPPIVVRFAHSTTIGSATLAPVMQALNLYEVLRITSVICWINKESSENVWSISDSRVTGERGGMTDNCPKLFAIDFKAFPASDAYRVAPARLFTFGFGFAGSTLVGTNVKEMLSMFVSNLNEVDFYDQKTDIQAKIPPLEEIANLTKKIAEKYISFLAVCYPKSCGCEFTIFGFCIRSNKYKIFRFFNEPSTPLNVQIKDCSDQGILILGDQKEKIENDIAKQREKHEENSVNWWRAPFISLSNIVREDKEKTIGGYMQLFIANNSMVRSYFLSSKELNPTLVGFDLFGEVGMLGGFLVNPSAGMSMPGEDGWRFNKQLKPTPGGSA